VRESLRGADLDLNPNDRIVRYGGDGVHWRAAGASVVGAGVGTTR